jgi:soluble lytic murein transglycosylase-like protein
VVPVAARDTNAARYSKFDASILEASKTFSVPEAFIRAVIRVESDYDPRVVSHAGAQGLMQLMPATAKRMQVKNSFDPHDNIMGGTRYLRYLANMFGGDMVLTISGYHAGEGAVMKYNGVPPYSSTHGYIKKVLKFYHYYKRKQRGNS